MEKEKRLREKRKREEEEILKEKEIEKMIRRIYGGI